MELAENFSDMEDEPFVDSGSDYIQSSSGASSDECSGPSTNKKKERKNAAKFKLNENLHSPESSSTSEGSSPDSSEDNDNLAASNMPIVVLDQWRIVDNNFVPRLRIPNEKPTTVLAKLDRSSSELEVFFKLFPKSLFLWIAEKTNERLEILQDKKKRPIQKTDQYEIMVVLGCFFVMSYNKVPAQRHYWSTNTSLGNTTIKKAISRNRFQLLSSKLYFNSPKKPDGSHKIYYIEEVLSCFKQTFPAARSESTFQSIDEAMSKFKGRSSLKQYLPLKPVKRGVKSWVRCDSKTGYTYDLNIYSGRDEDRNQNSTLGEDVVLKLASTIRDTDVSLCFDRFFTSTKLINTLPFAATGTAIITRKNMPKFVTDKKRERGESQFRCNQYGTCAVSWKDTKDVTVLSNCHTDETTVVKRKAKDGTRTEIPCPSMIEFYNKYMGGVDLSDQLVGLYDMDRKTRKWWKRVFYRLLMTAAVNSYIIFTELKGRENKRSFLDYLVPLAESLIAYGRQHAKVVRRRQYGRPSLNSRLMNIGDHLPVEGPSRRRCHRCTKRKQEKRTKTICAACNVPLCKHCFTAYHT